MAENFSVALVENAIRDEIANSNKMKSFCHEVWPTEIDSLVVVAIFVRIKSETNIEISESAIPEGGYSDEESCVKDIVAKCTEIWEKTQREIVGVVG